MSTTGYARRSHLSRQTSEPVLFVGGREFDVSNLFPGGVASPAQQPQVEDRTSRTGMRRRTQSGDAMFSRMGYEEDDDCFEQPRRRTQSSDAMFSRMGYEEDDDSFEQPRYPRRESRRERRQSGKTEAPLYPQRRDVLNDTKLDTEPAALVFRRSRRRKSITSCVTTDKDNLKKEAPISNLKKAPMSSAEEVERKLAPSVVLQKMAAPPKSYSLGGIWSSDEGADNSRDRSPSPERLPYTLRARSPSPPPYFERSRSPSPERSYTVRETSPSPHQSYYCTQSQPATPDSDLGFEESMQFDALPEIEVAPGVYKELRGSRETLYAVERGYAVTITCFCCGDKLRCVPDVEMVICPDCKVVSLLGEVDEDVYGRKRPFRPPRGVGLGLKVSGLQLGHASY